MHSLIEQHRTEILTVAARHRIRDVRVFGSMPRGEPDETRDVDLLVALPPHRTGLSLGVVSRRHPQKAMATGWWP